MVALRDSKLDFWIQKGYNVLFIGKHGVGKTSIITQAFNRNNLKWKYFSASTMDPFCDFIGVPKEKRNDDGSSYLDFVMPKEFQDDEVEALMFDEYNRSHKKVRNAVMELIQFKSINGKKFNNLKIVWAAINPDDDEDYDVEKLDPAQKDRFQVQVHVPYKPNLKYFTDTYGKNIAEAGISWWNELPEKIKNEISPRRLDYALDMYKNDGDLRDVLPSSSNVQKLLVTLKQGPIKKILQKFMDADDMQEARKFLINENNYASAIHYIAKSKKLIPFFLPLLSEERLATLLADNKLVRTYVTTNLKKVLVFHNAVQQVVAANTNRRLARELRRFLPKTKRGKAANWMATLARIVTRPSYNTNQRVSIYKDIKRSLPTLLTPNEAVVTLSALNSICSRSQLSTIRHSLRGIRKIVEQCVNCLANASPRPLCNLTGGPLGTTAESILRSYRLAAIEYKIHQQYPIKVKLVIT